MEYYGLIPIHQNNPRLNRLASAAINAQSLMNGLKLAGIIAVLVVMTHFSNYWINLNGISAGCWQASKSWRFILLFLPLRCKANSSLSPFTIRFVATIPYAGERTYPCPGWFIKEKFFRCISALPVIKENTTCSKKFIRSRPGFTEYFAMPFAICS